MTYKHKSVPFYEIGNAARTYLVEFVGLTFIVSETYAESYTVLYGAGLASSSVANALTADSPTWMGRFDFRIAGSFDEKYKPTVKIQVSPVDPSWYQFVVVSPMVYVGGEAKQEHKIIIAADEEDLFLRFPAFLMAKTSLPFDDSPENIRRIFNQLVRSRVLKSIGNRPYFCDEPLEPRWPKIGYIFDDTSERLNQILISNFAEVYNAQG